MGAKARAIPFGDVKPMQSRIKNRKAMFIFIPNQ